MCGIVGLWNLNGEPLSRAVLECFTDTLSHRGPDGHGVFVDDRASLGLGHRRLAIIDISETGYQPMSFDGDRYQIVFNGEIYNFLELRAELEKAGYRFKTDSDTEVILASYDHWGEDCQLHLNGMWAFAIWDRQEGRLFISRDRFGVKPLIYYFDGKRLAFASEMKAFLALDWFRLEFDPEVVATALTAHEQTEGTERCLLVGLKRLLGGYCLTLRKDGNLKIHRWWNTLDHLETAPQKYEDQVSRFRELFLDACRIRMRSDVPIGTALSGGLDSSSILCSMNQIGRAGYQADRIASEWQKAFVVTYPGYAIDERRFADAVIRHTGVEPVYCEVSPDMYLQYFDRVLFQFEEISDIHLGVWMVHKTQRENGVVVTIDGHGGDEALGGYPWHITASIKDAARRLNPLRVNELLNTMKGLDLFAREEFYVKSVQALGRKYLNRALRRKEQDWLIQKPAGFISPALEEDLPRLRGRDALFKKLYMDFHYTTLPMNLRDFDRLSMAHGVEVRSPFMDWRLVTFSFSIPSQSKIGKGFTKRILRDAMQGILPEAIRTRTKKLGFPNLTESWSSGKAREFVRDVIVSREFQELAIWNGRQIALDYERALLQQNDAVLYKAWVYVQAISLMKLFRDKKQNSL